MDEIERYLQQLKELREQQRKDDKRSFIVLVLFGTLAVTCEILLYTLI